MRQLPDQCSVVVFVEMSSHKLSICILNAILQRKEWEVHLVVLLGSLDVRHKGAAYEYVSRSMLFFVSNPCSLMPESNDSFRVSCSIDYFSRPEKFTCMLSSRFLNIGISVLAKNLCHNPLVQGNLLYRSSHNTQRTRSFKLHR